MSRKEVDGLISKCIALKWGVKKTGNGFTTITAPGGAIIIVPNTATGTTLANLEAELKRAGFRAEDIAAAKAEKAAAAMEADRKKNDAALARAEARAGVVPIPVFQDTLLEETIAAPTVPAAINPFTAPLLPRTRRATKTVGALAGYPRHVVYVNGKWAAEARAKKQCKQRPVYKTMSALWQQAMENAEWELNPADSLVFDEHGCLINGQHRMKGLEDSDPECIELFYPEGIDPETGEWHPAGVPFYVTTGFPSRLAHIFDTGKNRSTTDALAVEGLEGWTNLYSGALALAMYYDQSFTEGGEKLWHKWRNVKYTKREQVEAAKGPYNPIRGYATLASRAYSPHKVTRSSTLAAAYLIDRDNPDGSPGKPNSLWWAGVCGDDTLVVGDPRMALIRHTMQTTKKNHWGNGPSTLSHILRRYADWHLGKNVKVSNEDREVPLPPVWREGMQWFGQELRYKKGSTK